MNHFNIQPINRFAGSSAAIRRPKEIAYFSYDDNHEFHLDERSLRYYYTPRIGADLSGGFDTFQQVDDTVDEHLDSLLKTIVDLEKRTGAQCEADVVTWRGMMTKIMATPFDNLAGFELNATRFQDTIFLEESHPYKLSSRRAQHTRPSSAPPGVPSQDLMSYWGYKFETLSLLPAPWHATSRAYIESREDLPVSNLAQYVSVVKTGIGKVRMVLGGEVDGLWDCKPDVKDGWQGGGGGINWVELKTSAEMGMEMGRGGEREAVKWERKLLKFWIQSFLLGVPKIVVGFRSPQGVLLRVEELATKDIPGMVKRSGRGTWDGNSCINFAAGVFEWLKEVVVGEGVWRVRRRERSAVIEVFKVEEGGTGDVLSREFVEWRTREGEGEEQKQGGDGDEAGLTGDEMKPPDGTVMTG